MRLFILLFALMSLGLMSLGLMSPGLYGQSRTVFTSNTTSTTSWDSLSFGMLSRQVIISLDSDALNDTLWVSFSSATPVASNTIMLLSKYQGEALTLNVQSKFIKTKASATVKRRILVQ